jgi:hypothetical protein
MEQAGQFMLAVRDLAALVNGLLDRLLIRCLLAAIGHDLLVANAFLTARAGTVRATSQYSRFGGGAGGDKHCADKRYQRGGGGRRIASSAASRWR